MSTGRFPALRIMHVAEAPGGIERYLTSLLSTMNRLFPGEFEHILVCSPAFDPGKFEGLVAAVEIVPSMQNAIALGADTRSMRDVRRLIKKHRPDIVYCHSSKAGAIGRIADIGLSNLCIYNAHGWAFNMKGTSSKKTAVYQAVEKMLAPLTDAFICISDHEKRSALDHRIAGASRFHTICNGIDLNESRNLHPLTREQLNIPKDAFVVGAVGRLAAQKSPDIFVRMAGRICQKIPEAFFVMVGDGPQREETEDLIRQAGLEDRFRITGWVEDPLDYMGLFDTAVLLSRWEGFGLVLAEYMAAGVPIVATEVDAIPELIADGTNGMLVPPDDPDQACTAVCRLYADADLRRRLAENGRQIVLQRFDVERTAREHAGLFRRLLAGRDM